MRRITVVVPAHEQPAGVAPEAPGPLGLAVELPVVGAGAGLDVAVAARRLSGADYASYAARSASRTAVSAAARSSPRRRARWA